MENVRFLPVENYRTKLENYINEKYDQIAIKYLKEKTFNKVKQHFYPSNQGDEINVELVKSLREQIENLQSEIYFLREEMKEKNTLLKMMINSKSSPQEMTLSSHIYRQYQCKTASKNTPYHEQKCQNHFKNNLPIPATEALARVIPKI